jgi:hypothetical protein
MQIQIIDRIQQTTRLNGLLSIDHEAWHLSVSPSRYGDGIISFLAPNEWCVEAIAGHFTNGGDDCQVMLAFLTENDWYPVGVGQTFETSMGALIDRINSISRENFSLWKQAADLAARQFFEHYKTTRIAPLPNFEEYVRIKKEETYL